MSNNPLNLPGVSGTSLSATTLQWLINEDPYLAQTLTTAMNNGNLSSIVVGTPSNGAGAVYNNGVIIVSSTLVSQAESVIATINAGLASTLNKDSYYSILTMANQLGHEGWHGDVAAYVTNYINSQESNGNFAPNSSYYSTQTVNGVSITSFNSTNIVNNIIAEAAQNENGAMINGYNSDVSLLSTLSEANITLPSGVSPMSYSFGYNSDFGSGSVLNGSFTTGSISGLSGQFITLNVGAPANATTLLSGSNSATIGNIGLENRYYFSGPLTNLGVYGQVGYPSYNAMGAFLAIDSKIPTGTEIDYNFQSSGTGGAAVTPSGLINTLATSGAYYAANFASISSLSINDTSSGGNSGNTYHISWAPTGVVKGATVYAATVTTENADGVVTGAEAAGVNAVIAQGNIPVTVDANSSATLSNSATYDSVILGNNSTLYDPNNLSTAVTVNLPSNTIGLSLDPNLTSSVMISGGTASGGLTSEGDANVNIKAANQNSSVTVGIGADANVSISGSGTFSATMQNGSELVASGGTGQSVNAFCGTTPSGTPNGMTYSGSSPASVGCSINSQGVGTFTADANGDTFTQSANGSGTITGRNNTDSMGTGASLAANGAGNSVTGNGSNIINMTGGTSSARTTVTDSNSTLTVGANSVVKDIGNNDTINAAQNVNIGISGAGDTADFTGTGAVATVGGNGQTGAADYITFASGGTLIEAANSSVNAYGTGVIANAAGTDNLGLYGLNDTANISGNGTSVWAGNNGQTGAADYINFASSGTLTEAANSSVNAYGTGIIANAAGTDNLGLYGLNDTANITGTGTSVWAGNNGQTGAADYINFASGGTLNEAANSSVNAYGTGIIANAAGTDNLGLYGLNDTANISGNGTSIWAGNNGQTGAADYINFASGGTLNEAANSSVNAYGTGIIANAAGTDNLGLYGLNDTANISGNGTSVWAGNNGQTGAADYINFASGGTLNEAANSSVNAYGTGLTINAAGTDNLGLYGLNDTANITGNGTSVWAGNNGQTGAADYINFASGGTLNEAANSSVNAYGTGLTINAAGSDDLGLYGTGGTVNLVGKNSDLWVGNASGQSGDIASVSEAAGVTGSVINVGARFGDLNATGSGYTFNLGANDLSTNFK